MVRRHDDDSVDIESMRDMRDQILDEMRRGFAGVYSRQDHTNGRVLKTEKDVLLMGQLVETLHGNIKTIFRMLNRRIVQRTDEDTDAVRKPLSNKVVLSSVVAGTVAISEALQRLIPAIVEALKSWPQ
jgi:uncharacterized membrane protein